MNRTWSNLFINEEEFSFRIPASTQLMNAPVTSFIIPVLNGERDIARCLLSIKNLELSNKTYEVVVMDNGSTDSTQQIVKDLGFACHIVPRVKVGELRNRGAAIAQGAYLAFVDADVEVMPGWLRKGLVVFDDSRVVACGCFPGVPKDATWVQRTWDIHQRGRQQLIEAQPVAWLPSMNLLVRREAFLAVGGFNGRLTTAEDVDLCYRLGQVGTILYNTDMQAIHWGEACDLRTFWHKEVWRGTGNLGGVLSHGMRRDELPSLGYPLYMLSLLLLFGVVSTFEMWHWRMSLTPLNLGLLVLPALLLAIDTSCRAGQVAPLPKLFLLYLIYGFARAYSVIKASFLRQR